MLMMNDAKVQYCCTMVWTLQGAMLMIDDAKVQYCCTMVWTRPETYGLKK
jgi:hypothetical protein